MARLIVRRGDKKETYRLLEETVVVGRSKECTIPVDDVKSSRKHCEVFEKDGRYVVRDLGSRNGTQLNGLPVEEEILKPGDVIAIGKTTLTFEVDGEVEEPVAEPAAAAPEPKLEILDLEDDVVTQVSERRPVAAGVGENEEDETVAESRPEGRWQLIWQAGEEEKTHPLEMGTVSIGRSRKNTIALPDEVSISSKHAKVYPEGGRWHLADVGSTNGSKVNRKRIEGPVALADGDRIELGDVRFYFARESTGSPLDARPEAADIDLEAARPGEAGGGGWVLLATSAGLVLGLFGGLLGFHAWSSRPAGEAGAGADLASGNRIADGSFEAGADGERRPLRWDGSDAGVLITGERPRTGTWALVFGPPPAGGARFHREAVHGEPIPVSPAKVYEVSGWVLPADSTGVAGIDVTFLGKPAKEGAPAPVLGRHRCGLVGGAAPEWTEIKSRVQPPTGAESARVHCFVAGAGAASKVLFDDCALVESGGAAAVGPGASLAAGDVRFDADNRGVGTLRRAGTGEERLGEIYLHVDRGGKVLFDQRYGLLDEGHPRLETIALEGDRRVGALVSRGRLFAFAGGDWVRFETRTYPVEEVLGLAFEALVEPAEGAIDASAFLGIRATVGHRFLESGTGVLTPQDSTAHFGGFQSEGVEQILWQAGGDRLGVYYPLPAIVRLSTAEEGAVLDQRLVVALAGGEGNRLSTTAILRTAFDRQEVEYRGLLEEFDQAQRRGRPGRALVLLETIKRRFPFHSRNEEVEGPYARLRDQAEETVAGLRAGLDRAGFFRQEMAYASLEERCQQAAEAWDGHPTAEEVRAVLDVASRELANLDSAEAAAVSALLLARAEDCLALGRSALARAFLQRIVEAYGGSAAAERARELLEGSR